MEGMERMQSKHKIVDSNSTSASFLYGVFIRYAFHFDLRFFDSIKKSGRSGIRILDVVLTVYSL